MVDLEPHWVLGDKAYSSSAIRAQLRRRRIKAAIPEPADQIRGRRRPGKQGGRPPAFGPVSYRQRPTVERAFNQLRQHRAVATRYDERDVIYRGSVDAAAIQIWAPRPGTPSPARHVLVVAVWPGRPPFAMFAGRLVLARCGG